MTTGAEEPTTALQVTTPELVREAERKLGDPGAGPGVLDRQADRFVQQLLALDAADEAAQAEGAAAVSAMASEAQAHATRQMSLLSRPIKDLVGRTQEGGDVARSLIDLKVQVEALDPAQLDLSPGWWGRLLGSLPWVGTPLKRYVTRFESAQDVVAAIVRSLEQGREQLIRDNITLREDQKAMRAATRRLAQAVELGQRVDERLAAHLERTQDEQRRRFLSEHLLLPLRQRLVDLQQQLAVNQQGVLAVELVVRNNEELGRGVQRALNVTVTALRVGATVAMALASQSAVQEKLDEVTRTTEALLAGTAERLRDQGAAIQARAAGAQLNVGTMREAFKATYAALDDLARFRQSALPQLAAAVQELDQITREADLALNRLEAGRRAATHLKFELGEG